MSFSQDVWEVTREIPKGRVSTYKEIAEALGTKAYRAVGNALNRNPYAPEVPCHRIVKSNGEVGGFASGTENKKHLLMAEGIKFNGNTIENFEGVFFRL